MCKLIEIQEIILKNITDKNKIVDIVHKNIF